LSISKGAVGVLKVEGVRDPWGWKKKERGLILLENAGGGPHMQVNEENPDKGATRGNNYPIGGPRPGREAA